MTETDRIKNALVNVITLAKNSIEYGKARDDQDIDLIESIVKKAISDYVQKTYLIEDK